MIWLFTWGSRGDVEPAEALALALREGGYRVRVFGAVEMRKTFVAHGLDFDPLDMDPITNPADRSGSLRHLTLEKLASDAGFQGPDKVGDYLFDTKLLHQECSNRNFTQLLESGRSVEEAGFLAGQMPGMAEMQGFEVGRGIERLNETRRKLAGSLAQFHQQALEEYLPVAGRARRAFLEFLRPLARDACLTPYELLRAVGTSFRHYSMPSVAAEAQRGDGDVRKRFIEMVRDFDSWYDILAKDAKGSLDEYWKRWLSRFPPLEGIRSAFNYGDCSPRATLNMKLWYGSASPAERPDLIIAHAMVYSSAVVLQAEAGVKVLYWASTTTHWQRLRNFANDFVQMCKFEGDWPGVEVPVRSGGPLRYVRMLLSGWVLASTTALTMHKASPSMRRARECCTGQWVLDGQQDAGANFGTPQEREELDAFLAAEGGAPVYFGWGSMGMANLEGAPEGSGPEGHARLIVKTLRRVGRRGVFVAGWSSLGPGTLQDVIEREYEDDPDEAQRAKRRILLLGSASHEYLFPRCSCTVHHGGSGTTHAALRSGVPTIIAPLIPDQASQGDWIVSLGCGAKVANLAKVTVQELAEAVTRVLSEDSYRVKAKEVAAVMAEERGAASAVEKVARCLRESQPPYSAPAQRDRIWRDGLYEFHKGGAWDFGPLVLVFGEGIFNPKMVPVGQLWAGDFCVEGNDDGIRPGSYTLQAAKGDTVNFGAVSDDGLELLWQDGSRHVWKAPARLQDGLYYTWRDVKLPSPPTVVRGGKFFVDGAEVGSMEAGNFQLKKDGGDGRKAGQYLFKAYGPSLQREQFGMLSADGKTMNFDDGSSMRWESPPP